MLKRSLSVVFLLGLVFQVFAAPTLQQRVNASKGLDDATTALFVDKVEQAIKQVAQDVINGNIVYNDTMFTNHGGVSQTQLIEWAFRALRGSLNQLMIPMIMDDPRLNAAIQNSTDNQIKAAARACVWPFVKQIGSGSF